MRSNTQATICCSFVRTLQTLIEQSTTVVDTRESFAFEPARLIASLVNGISIQVLFQHVAVAHHRAPWCLAWTATAALSPSLLSCTMDREEVAMEHAA
jgi:hypothetical protein